MATAGTNVPKADMAPSPAVWVLVQEAERKIPINYANRYRNAALSKQSYLPFKVCAVAMTLAWQSLTLVVCPSAACRAVLRVVLACDQPLHVNDRHSEGLPSLGKAYQSRGQPDCSLRQ